MIKSIKIIYAKSTGEIFNRKSALGSYIHCFARIFTEKGFQVELNELNSLEYILNGNVVQNRSRSFLTLIPLFAKNILKNVLLFKKTNNLYNRIKQNFRSELVIEFYTYGSNIGYKLSKKFNTRLIVVYDNPVLEEHTFFNGQQLIFDSIVEKREKESLLGAKAIVVYSNAVKKYLFKKYNANLPIYVHQNVDFTRFDFIHTKPSLDTINIGFIGSFLKWHRVDLLLDAFLELKKDKKNIKLFLLGNGSEYEEIRETIKLKKIEKDVVMPGFVDGDNLLSYKQKLHIGIMPGSNWYGAPNKIFEYGAAKMAVVAPNTPTISDLFVDEKEILLFKQDNLLDLVDKIRYLLDNLELIDSLSTSLQNKIQLSYSEEQTFRFYSDIINKP